MTQLLRELRRRRGAPGTARRPAPGNRWRGWARSLAARRRRTTTAASLSRMLLLLRGAAPAVGDATRQPAASHAWHLYLTLGRAMGPAAPAVITRGTGPVTRVHSGSRARPTAAGARPAQLPAAAVGQPGTVAVTRTSTERLHTIWRAPVGSSAAASPAADRTAVPHLVTGDTVTTAARHTVHRVRERGRRVEERPAAALPPPAGGSGWPPGPPSMTVTRQPSRREPGGGPTAGHGRDPAALSLPGQPGPRPAQESPSPIDVEQLADQVVRRIDDRIIAHRERLGRI